MRILVTGGAGFIGSHVVDAYVAAGHDVAVVDNLVNGRRENLNPEAAFYEVDIRDAGALDEVFEREQPEVVNHHAAQIDVRRSVTEPIYDAEVNVLGALNVLEGARRYDAEQVIFISSAAVYGMPVYLPIDEEHPIRPLSPYGASKYAIETYLNVYRETHGLRTTVFRYANVYGPRQDPYGEAGVVAIFVSRMLDPEGPPPVINGSGEQTRDFVYVGDCARANVMALTQETSGVYNLGTGEETSVNELAAAIQALTGYPGEIAHGPAKAGDVARHYADASRAEAALGWRAEVDLRTGLAETVAYFEAKGRK
ncbi:MAG: NAD-dependent epimerase/dehydratase family protein [Anaerolineae bacterium]